ncbi:MAG: prepilin-type N-terminal cleavage/methylation domain-containing protein [Candidatus Liptonbacteria bacterium]|nr:prepilin-type N-terminal cleavage/methylation domain-containing protein [Candidatus Liptonbacteria bacterium]
MRKFPCSEKGQSLVEILIALAVGSIFIIGATSIIIPSLRSNAQANRIQVGAAIGKELLENVRVSSEADWRIIYDLNKGQSNRYHLTTSTSPFAAVAGEETIAVSTTTYTRYFYINNVGRDASGNIISTGGVDDPSTQKITVVYGWQNGTTSSIQTYLTRFMNNAFSQTDWSGGPGQDGPASTVNNQFSTSSQINYSTTTGSIVIQF